MGISKSISQINLEKPADSRLTAISFSDKKGKHRTRYINCICSCGNSKIVALPEITTGGTLSCGCLFKEKLIARNTKFKNNVHEINVCYLDMIRRCYDKECLNYRFYGAKGVKVCHEWLSNYQSFLDWAISSGWQKGLQLDKDIKGGGKIYSPDTCIWVTSKANLEATGIRKRNPQGKFISA